MNKPFKKIGIAIAILIVIGIAVRIVTRGRGETVESISDIQKREGVPVRVETAARGSIARTLQFSGTIEGQEQSVIISRLMETVRRDSGPGRTTRVQRPSRGSLGRRQSAGHVPAGESDVG